MTGALEKHRSRLVGVVGRSASGVRAGATVRLFPTISFQDVLASAMGHESLRSRMVSATIPTSAELPGTQAASAELDDATRASGG